MNTENIIVTPSLNTAEGVIEISRLSGINDKFVIFPLETHNSPRKIMKFSDYLKTEDGQKLQEKWTSLRKGHTIDIAYDLAPSFYKFMPNLKHVTDIKNFMDSLEEASSKNREYAVTLKRDEIGNLARELVNLRYENEKLRKEALSDDVKKALKSVFDEQKS